MTSGALHCLHVPHHRVLDDLQLLGRAELDELAAGVGERDVAGREVERVAGLEDLLVVGEAIREPALEDVAPVRALAAVVRAAP